MEISLVDAIKLVLVGLAAALSAIATVLSAKTRAGLVEVKNDVKVVERATNSMKDALVAAAGREGIVTGRQEERARADSVALAPPTVGQAAILAEAILAAAKLAADKVIAEAKLAGGGHEG